AKGAVHLIVLKKGVPSPLAKESDEEKAEQADTGKPKDKDGKKDGEEVVIDFDGIDQRVVPLPIPAGEFSNLQAGSAGQIFYLQASATRSDPLPSGTLQRFDLTKRK